MALRPKVIRADRTAAGRMPAAVANEDNYLKALLKWIPIEVVGVYEAIMAVVPMKEADQRLVITLIMVPLCFLWIIFATKDPQGVGWRQVILATLAFIFWSAAVQNEVLDKRWVEWQRYTGPALLIGGSGLILPIVEGILKKIGVPQNP